MTAGRSIVGIIVAAGVGARSGLDAPKQYAPLGGQAVLAHSHAALASHPRIGRVIVAIGPGQEAMAREALAGVAEDPWLVEGGATRRESVMAALAEIEAAGGADAVLIHDAARPFLPSAVIDRLIEALERHDGAIPALAVADTLVRETGGAMGGPVARDGLMRVQTPQAFRFDAILNAHRACPADADVTDDAGLLRLMDIPVALVEGDPMLDKLTYPADFARAEEMLRARMVPRTGTGYDVHRLVPGKPLWLCGVEIAHEAGLSGHSDADVAIHALVDAILGALAEGDIGQHFPPSDPRWKGAASHRFLEFARNRVKARGGAITHVDVTIICEAPKIGPHRDAMRARLADLLALPLARVSVKATTTERLGFTGRKEGIAAQAVATLLLPEL
ncbi:bifunctional 2-C-methyl-D-erythritol 4-phosphate cytidylyltransferase/2-C-methyl-D-erythritol 2,4-cyclodiphosphate synthase [Sphingobium sp. DEHP117]|uniref:bifunctional 2-C-methyl-D-erythritol 4-phosphate cytidylyltransferase/2-C-methyl-D-erythritol 2,4-cyclodiphosphate synthase n=1 Tax=Sphingobium sp. DEHP117 TaxID=2993436 RepID=UPI0027D736CC|nr:bifunctional 2-C-methyl-D-erythritol 4-phosphate cytidylyltransferase/2-C-methyl-D-erythritol 2,4-cyclodiphosphate synthase [Sphingobium sp. DEHP117]MDQ4419749.1 bifunctional 2-C-methyl-D-erythritol 4-phosphate cytidylyltransferase/2-C-methyl-D-erythritol 2,4-cyclodiphosphate synthase [Sphingobium sp. DEHP117]